MFKKITATILLLAFVSQTFAGPFVMLDYYLNTVAYAKNCINKARPQMHCNGKCQAMKKIQEEEKKEQQNAERKAEGKMQQVLSSRSFFCTVDAATSVSTKHYLPFDNKGTCQIPQAIFHPPQF